MRLEEKKSIEYLKYHIIPVYGKKGQIEYFLNDIVLNLIEKQSKEIEELFAENQSLKYTNGNMIHKDVVRVNYTSNDKIKAKIDDILNSENSEAIEKLIEWQSLLEKE